MQIPDLIPKLIPEVEIPAAFRFSVAFYLQGSDAKPEEIRFQRVSGLASEIKTQTLTEGGQNLYAQQLPENVSHPNLVLEGSFALKSKLDEQNHNAFSLFSFKPCNVMVSLLGEQKQPLASWLFINTYPVKWLMADFNAAETAFAIDTLELAYSRRQRVSV